MKYFLVTNTIFEVSKRRCYTWITLGDTNCYQIDYILAKRLFKNQIMTSHSFPGEEIISDHNLVVIKYKLIHKKITKRPKCKIWDIEKLKNEEIKQSS